MADLIDRQAVKDIIKNHKSDFSTEKDYRTARACVNAVLSASYQQVTSKLNLIDRQQAIDAVAKWFYDVFGIKEYDGTATIFKRLRELPSAQFATDINVGDMVSRQQAIDALNVLCQEHRYRIPGKRETYSEYNEAWQDALDRAEGAIFNLPSAQPERKRGKWLDIQGEEKYVGYWAECSACGEWSEYITDFCPNCGARMDMGESE